MLLLSAIDHIVLRVILLDSMALFIATCLAASGKGKLRSWVLCNCGQAALIDLVAVHGELGKSGGIAPVMRVAIWTISA